MTSKLEFVKTGKILNESIQDECFTLANSILHIVVSEKDGKQINGKDAIKRLANNKITDTELLQDLEDVMNVAIQPFMTELVKKQFPGFKLVPHASNSGPIELAVVNPENMSDVEWEDANHGDLSAHPLMAMKEYAVHLSVNILHGMSRPKDVVDTIFHELVHFCQKMLAPVTDSDKANPPYVKFANKIYSPENMYSSWNDGETVKTYEHQPKEIEAHIYDTVYPKLNIKSTRGNKGFSVIDRICASPKFINIAASTEDIDSLIALISEACMRDEIIKKAYYSLKDFSSREAEAYLSKASDVSRKRSLLPNAGEVKKVRFYKKAVDTFINANLSAILYQINKNLEGKYPGKVFRFV